MSDSKYLWIMMAGVCLLVSGCSYRQAYIDGQEEHLLSDDHSRVNNTQESYHTSVLESGLDSEQTMNARIEQNDAQHKLVTDQRHYDDYLSASGQSTDLRQ